ncbi:MAG: hypothetical protein II828_06640 [Clostridia bacterium]|nr:hypothetical protein [Clostridia bacterium]
MKMQIKLIEPTVAEILLPKETLAAFGLTADRITPRRADARKLLTVLFDLLESLCGLRRDGCFTFAECRPYINGNCRLCVGFTRLPSQRLYAFACADDLLDALSRVRYISSSDVFRVEPSGDRFLLYYAQSPDNQINAAHNLAVLSEYAMC